MDTISLSGPWTLRLDPDNKGYRENPPDKVIDGTIYLPGTTDEYGYGEPVEEDSRDHLERTHRYEGPAWYRRPVTIPDEWAGKRVTLTLERTRPTEVWLDGERLGSRECLSTPHVYEFPGLEPGEYDLAICVDNTDESMDRAGVERSHAASEHTQTNWNGIVGEIRLDASPPVRIEHVRTTPNVAENAVDLAVTLDAPSTDALEGTLTATARSVTGDEVHVPDPLECAVSVDASEWTDGQTTLEYTYDLGPDALIWTSSRRQRTISPSRSRSRRTQTVVSTSMRRRPGCVRSTPTARSFRSMAAQSSCAGRTDCCVFPETGYPPTTTAEWVEHMETAKSYGINHYRFHSWCPPAAAFEAADRVGIYLQPECSQWDFGTSLVEDGDYDYYKREAERILERYGNHPSFVAFTLGNENKGDEERLNELVQHCRKFDDRRLYAYGANNFLMSPRPGAADDFFITANVPDEPTADPETVGRTPIRGTGHINDTPPSTTVDYESELAAYDIPVIGHEIGQYQIHPNYDETRKYRGVLRARNLERFERSLADRFMAGRDRAFQHASGQLAISCYREDIEAAFRTEGFGGFQLLGLQDFPGQGTAMVGLLDSFMESKGLLEAHEWRQFCAARVPLLSFERYTATTADAFVAEATFANYGPGAVTDATQRGRSPHPTKPTSRLAHSSATTSSRAHLRRLALSTHRSPMSTHPPNSR